MSFNVGEFLCSVHVVVVQQIQQPRNVQKSVMHVQNCCFANPISLLFAVLVVVVVA